jgi:hypothetical protein
MNPDDEDTYESLLTGRRHAAFAVVGAVKALVFVHEQTGTPITASDLKPLVESFDRADAALRKFDTKAAAATESEVA